MTPSSNTFKTTSPEQDNSSSTDGTWIGIDLGTTNSTVAVWDSERGRPKVMQLGPVAQPRRGKTGRHVPSVLRIQQQASAAVGEQEEDPIIKQGLSAIVGYPALLSAGEHDGGEDTPPTGGDDSVLLSSVKRVLGRSGHLKEFESLLGLDIVASATGEDLEFQLHFSEASSAKVTLSQIFAVFLREMKKQAERYLQTTGRKKRLRIPNHGSTCRNVVLGVPAHVSRQERQLLLEAARLAGFDGQVQTLIESTAATMAYGLLVSIKEAKHVLVFDMGGGTTDVTLSRMDGKNSDGGHVVTTVGDARLGGDDMDVALLEAALKKKNMNVEHSHRQTLLRQCQKAKEALCGTDDDPPVERIAIQLADGSNPPTRIELNQDDLEVAITPIVNQARKLVQRAVDQSSSLKNVSMVDEIVLVGGATRVPTVRRMLKELFPHIKELCQSLSPESAVAQGCAIQAALLSGTVPHSEIQSAMMLDALPHSIGVLHPDGTSMVEILPKDSPLPAQGHATFTLEDPGQRGVTVIAVEQTPDQGLVRVGEFDFLLHRLSRPPAKREVKIAFHLDTSGAFSASFYDELDPEHVWKRQQYEQGGGNSTFIVIPPSDEESFPWALSIAVAFLAVMYVLAKLVFHEVEESAQIL